MRWLVHRLGNQCRTADQRSPADDVSVHGIVDGSACLHDISRDWMARATSEAEFAFRLPNKLTAAQSVPDAFTAYHEWLNEWMSMCSEDGRRLVADSQRIMDKGVRCFVPASPGATT